MASGADVDVVSKLEKAISYACGILGYEKLRDFQKEGVAAVLKDQDVFVAKPTGSGKSLIFQLVPFATDFIHKFDSEGPGLNLATLKENPENFALVVSPLISLMKDQVHQLKEKGITALSLSDENVTGEQLKKTNYSFLYSSPETILRNYRKEFKSKELQKKLCCVVVDESHCIIKW